jgi:hypothetical protein
VEEHFNIDKLCNVFGLSVVLEMMVPEAANGLIVEGILACRQERGESMARELLNVRKGTLQEITACCARLYCKDSFLYHKLNECMRLMGDEEYEQLWKQKARTLGPFAWLLELLPNPYTDQNMTVYRNAALSDDLIEQFRQSVNPHPKLMFHFPAFTSTSRNQGKVEVRGGNVLFVIIVNEDEVRDISPYSEFGEAEEEMLLLPTSCFSIQSCCFDETEHKWFIHLKSMRAH